MKDKLRNIYAKFLESLDPDNPLSFKMLKLVHNIDININNKIKTLFLISLFCNVFYHIYGKNRGQLKKKLNFSPKIRCNNYNIFAYDNNKTDKLLKDLVTFFNTDANNLLPITGLILQDLNNMKVYMNI